MAFKLRSGNKPSPTKFFGRIARGLKSTFGGGGTDRSHELMQGWIEQAKRGTGGKTMMQRGKEGSVRVTSPFFHSKKDEWTPEEETEKMKIEKMKRKLSAGI